ncbi:MAG TPA: trypsin-like peptidase domain-containing protein [Streptosporangiaceae bacterium]|nr:trypsin-like peptidase domain-containing protein [Streptosporangiaceae bacterium]
MDTVHGQPEAQGPAYPESQSPQPGAGFPAGPGIPSGPEGWYPAPPPPPRRRPRRLLAGVVAAGVAFAAGAGATAWAVGLPGSGGGALTGNRVLSTASIVQMTDPAVVDIVSNLGTQGAESAGTGIVLTSSGEVLTNNHVVDGATAIRVTDVGNGQTYSATVTGYDATRDVAVLKLSGASGLRTATIGDSGAVRTGQKVVALGNAGGRGGLPSVAEGRVTGLGRAITAQDQGSGSSERLTGMIQTNAGIQPGDSGGPLLNTAGQVIGMDTAASNEQTAAATGTEQAFAIPIDRAMSIASQITAGTASATVHIGPTAFLGVEISSQASGQAGVPGSPVNGAPVAGVVPGGAAANAGIGAGDVIVSLGGTTISSPTGLRNSLTTRHPGDSVPVTWLDQSGQSHSANVVLGTGPAA